MEFPLNDYWCKCLLYRENVHGYFFKKVKDGELK